MENALLIRLYEECHIVVRVNEFSYIIEIIFFDNYKKDIIN